MANTLHGDGGKRVHALTGDVAMHSLMHALTGDMAMHSLMRVVVNASSVVVMGVAMGDGLGVETVGAAGAASGLYGGGVVDQAKCTDADDVVASDLRDHNALNVNAKTGVHYGQQKHYYCQSECAGLSGTLPEKPGASRGWAQGLPHQRRLGMVGVSDPCQIGWQDRDEAVMTRMECDFPGFVCSLCLCR